MTWRPKSTFSIFFQRLAGPIKLPFRHEWPSCWPVRRFQVNPSPHLASAPLEERASKSLLPQVVSGGNKRNFERAASMFVCQASRRCWSWVPPATTWQEPAVWEWLLRSSSGRLLRKAGLNESTCVSLENFVRSPYKGLRRRRAGLTFFFFLNQFAQCSHVMTRAPAGLT